LGAATLPANYRLRTPARGLARRVHALLVAALALRCLLVRPVGVGGLGLGDWRLMRLPGGTYRIPRSELERLRKSPPT
jgi:hypothetical protein